MPKCWYSAGVAGDIQQSYNAASITDQTTGLTAVVFTTNQSAATYSVQVTVEMTASTYSVALDRKCKLASATRATTGFQTVCIDSTATTHLVKDPTTFHGLVMGDF
jgi:hypothetical protein